jgi:hypothetical protein
MGAFDSEVFWIKMFFFYSRISVKNAVFLIFQKISKNYECTGKKCFYIDDTPPRAQSYQQKISDLRIFMKKSKQDWIPSIFSEKVIKII